MSQRVVIDDFDAAVRHIFTQLRERSAPRAAVETQWDNVSFGLTGMPLNGSFTYVTTSIEEDTAKALQRHLKSTYNTEGIRRPGSKKGLYWVGFSLTV